MTRRAIISCTSRGSHTHAPGRVVLLLLASLLGCGGASASNPSEAPPDPVGSSASSGCDRLPAPTGVVVNVSPSQAASLPSIVAAATPGTVILLADGTYANVPRINITTASVALRSASGNPAAVVLDGAYTTDEIVSIHAPNVTVAEITLMHAVNHPIHVAPPEAGPDVTGVRLYRLRILDAGEQFVKVNANAARTSWVDNGSLECSTLQLTDAGRPHVVAVAGSPCYTGGIDAHAVRGWTVRRNRFEGLWCPTGLAEHAIHFWDSSRDTLVEQNLIVNCARGIGYGLGDTGVERPFADAPYPGVTYIGHYDGIIRNNVVYADIPGFDTGIGLEQARGARVWHNTVYSTDSATGFFSSIDYRFANTVAEIRNNLCRRITQRNGASGAVDDNLENVPASDFVDPAARDFRLTATATDAIDQGVVVADPGLDMAGNPHDAAPDLGAYEFERP
jgi:hypothetical protein